MKQYLKENKIQLQFPKIGQRIIRSVIGVMLCFVVYYIRGCRGIPFYSALAVLQCIQPYYENSVKMAKQRTLGTFIGAFWGLIMLLLELYFLPDFVRTSILGYALISLMTGVVLYTTVMINKKNASYFSCIVFLSITVMHMTDASPFIFVLNRVVDTLLGVIMAVIVNSCHLPRKRKRDILFVSGIDDALLNRENVITPFSKVELNRMIADGAQFTVSTMRTPASIMDALSDIHFQIPIITMDGAALFDMEKNSYLLTYLLPYRDTRKILGFIREYQMTCFVNVIIDDLLIIYYEELFNEAEKDIVNKLRKSPYRNYVKRKLPEGEEVSYIMLVDKKDRIEQLYHGFELCNYTEDYKILKYDSKEYAGYAYIKIYNRQATRDNMLGNLKAMLNLDKSVIFGSEKGKSDLWIENADENQVVKELKRLYEPISLLK